MGLSESSLNTITKPFSFFYHIVKYHVIVHVFSNYVVKITIAFVMSIPMNITMTAIKKNK